MEKQNKVFVDWLDQSQKQNVKHIEEDGGNRGLYGYQEEKELMEISRPEVCKCYERKYHIMQMMTK